MGKKRFKAEQIIRVNQFFGVGSLSLECCKLLKK
jgi:hypothetical protein